VKDLSRNDAYTLHKSARVRFPRRKTYSKCPGDLFQTDLVDLSNISSYNDGYFYLLTCLDVFSKRGWAVADSCKPNMVQSDKGTEFSNSTFQSMLKHDIKFFTPVKRKTSKQP